MPNQRRSIMGALDFSIETLSNIKKTLLVADAKYQNLNFAVAGMIVAPVSQLLKIMTDVIEEAGHESSTAKADMEKVKSRFNEFLDKMLVNQE